MKITIIFAVLVVILASDLVFGVPLQRQKRWDLFSRARDWFNDVGDQISVSYSETADKLSDLADTAAARTRQHLQHAADHFEEIGNNARESLDNARGRLQEINS